MPNDIYEISGDTDLGSAFCRDRVDVLPVEKAINDQARYSASNPVPLYVGNCGKRSAPVLTHSLGFGCGGLLLDDGAVDVLEPMLSGAGYVIDTAIEAERHYRIFVCERVLDAVDQARGEYERYKSTGNVSDVIRYEFHEDRLGGADIFKIKGLRARLFVTDRFVSLVNQHQLLGFRFLHVWNQQTRGVRFNPHEWKYEAYPGETGDLAGAKRRAAREAMGKRRANTAAAEE